jgi:hypothetical protein
MCIKILGQSLVKSDVRNLGITFFRDFYFEAYWVVTTPTLPKAINGLPHVQSHKEFSQIWLKFDILSYHAARICSFYRIYLVFC